MVRILPESMSKHSLSYQEKNDQFATILAWCSPAGLLQPWPKQPVKHFDQGMGRLEKFWNHRFGDIWIWHATNELKICRTPWGFGMACSICSPNEDMYFTYFASFRAYHCWKCFMNKTHANDVLKCGTHGLWIMDWNIGLKQRPNWMIPQHPLRFLVTSASIGEWSPLTHRSRTLESCSDLPKIHKSERWSRR